ncbi:ATP phosphoribosyltransferase (EC 2.4.2.17) _ HisGs [uncultured Gammaproteobacteria bacterium]|jgi:ATP phosphoribosyltransferase|nr:ATP phosphoribosyltransferase (EC => HisGs [Bathymodiolus brooksi thiotrophic gill symbiont]CAC9559908.1 ATP phosphoribosyltransferase (EC 2.4.2.17) > HisGs [uncultured Gammaproteobacteria bacterium]CAB9544278.1 ATP phosphoribosyltransferase (EC => HisGs [Bathymodiolus brooksi thiotrophic gill symbiont]CAC9604913.1 ATP phosphoribosyltransferase (EC 2.4.2.17) > HisGs [uncultured Gammaproteobacteria bacterium]CAC9625253.1 ATP phosphoribosyltransferase (EC 2.4.2.17) > HisGs [uncultured Gammapro
MLTIALSKGRILEQTLPLLKKAGLEIADTELNSRKLILDTNFDDIKVIVIRATDVPVFVQHGAADMGIAGKDVLLEHGANGLFELLDLGIAKCKLMVAASDENQLKQDTLKIATKYVNSAKQYFEAKSQQIEIIKLYGAMELAPVVGLAHCIVDLVDTGNTLKANGLMPLEHIKDISSRLVVNTASFKTKNTQIKSWICNIEKNL